MRTRSVAALVAGAAAVGLVLQGCSSGSDDGSGDAGTNGKVKTLSEMVAANGLYPEEQKKWFQEVSDQFEKETGATVKFETFSSANDELTKIQTSVLSGQGPDIYGLGSTFTPTAYSTGAFVELGEKEWSELGGKDKFVPSSLGISGPSDDHQVGIPFASRPFVMAYNKKLLADAGITDLPTTWDELAADAKKVSGNGVHGLAIGYADGYDPWKFAWAMSLQAGNSLLDLTTKKATIDAPAVAAAYKAYFSWYSDGLTDPAAIGWQNAQAVAAFADGKAAFVPMVSASSKVTLDKSAVKDDYAYALMPTVPPGQTSNPSGGKPAASIISGDNWVVAKYSSQQSLAFALIKMLTSTDDQVKYFKTFGEMPTNAEAAEQVEKSDPSLAPIVDAAAKSVGTPFSGAWGDTQLALTNVVVQALPTLQKGAMSDSQIASALKTAQESAQKSLDKAK